MSRVREFWGYIRPDGRVGVCNYVAVIAGMDNANPVARRISAAVNGTICIAPSFGRGQIADDFEQHLRTLEGIGTNPNVAGAVVVSLHAASARGIAERIGKNGKPVEWISLQDVGGTVKAAQLGVSAANKMVTQHSRARRELVPLSDLVLGVECGGSDAISGVSTNPATGIVADWVVEAGGTVILSETVEMIGAEHILARRAVNKDVGNQILAATKWYEDYSRQCGIEISQTNPAPDNIKGGLSTIEEKALGAIRKGGSAPVQEVLRYAERPTKKGLVMMDAPPPGTENITGLSGAGCQIIIFTTGVGNPIGSPVSPTIKVTANPRTAVDFADNIDVDISGILTGRQRLVEASEVLYLAMLEVANGRVTTSEALGDTEVAITRIGFSI